VVDIPFWTVASFLASSRHGFLFYNSRANIISACMEDRMSTVTRITLALIGVFLLITVSAAQGPPPTAQSGERDGQKFKLFGAAQDDIDPDNPDNEVISTNITLPTPFFGGVFRDLPPGTKIEMLDNQLEAKYRFSMGRSCGGGSPRIQLAIDLNGDGTSDGNAFGYFAVPSLRLPDALRICGRLRT
jgi:hypothetical protein